MRNFGLKPKRVYRPTPWTLLGAIVGFVIAVLVILSGVFS